MGRSGTMSQAYCWELSSDIIVETISEDNSKQQAWERVQDNYHRGEQCIDELMTF